MAWFPVSVFVVFMLAWGATVVPDSPQFSALVAQNAIPEYRATAITTNTCIGFPITIPSLYFTQWFFQNIFERLVSSDWPRVAYWA
ncbi:MAG: hypothetical protein KIS77_07625 [Saprospiraceae bacterium]|nr:hypothetical protein [Saprospiraceae bacterium]